MLSAYVKSQARWSEEVAALWTNKRSKMLSRTKMFSRCGDQNVKTSIQAVMSTDVMDAIENELKAFSKAQPALCNSKVVALVRRAFP